MKKLSIIVTIMAIMGGCNGGSGEARVLAADGTGAPGAPAPAPLTLAGKCYRFFIPHNQFPCGTAYLATTPLKTNYPVLNLSDPGESESAFIKLIDQTVYAEDFATLLTSLPSDIVVPSTTDQQADPVASMTTLLNTQLQSGELKAPNWYWEVDCSPYVVVIKDPSTNSAMCEITGKLNGNSFKPGSCTGAYIDSDTSTLDKALMMQMLDNNCMSITE